MVLRKKICFVVSSPITVTAFLMKHIEYLSEYYDIYLVANFQDTNLEIPSVRIKQVKNIAIKRGVSVFGDLRTIQVLRQHFVKEQFDAVHSITPKAGLVGMIASKWVGVKVRTHIFTGQVWHTKKGLFKSLLKALDRLIVWCATDILVDGESQRKFLIENRIVSGLNSQVLGRGSISGVDTSKFSPNSDLYRTTREALGIDNEVVFLFLGRLNHDKGILDLVNAFLKLNAIHLNTRLVLVGPDEENMAVNIRAISLNENIIIYGATSKPQEALQMADVFCLPSYREGFGTSVIEASLLEKPVICSDTYGLMETIIENETGLRHKVADVNSLFEQMQKMMSEGLRKKLGENGRNYILKNFSADTISQHWLEYYRGRLG
jgi:glycosyltransferase involved in cell wall biosynthesis